MPRTRSPSARGPRPARAEVDSQPRKSHDWWPLGPARAFVRRDGDEVTVDVRGIVTAQAYEVLNFRLALERPAARRTLFLGRMAVLAVTCISAVEATVRGTPIAQGGSRFPVFIGVHRARLPWAVEHCQRLGQEGICRVPFELSDGLPS